MATAQLSATPSTPPTYNPSIADTFSWVPVEGAGRPLYARASYLVGADLNLTMGDLNVNMADVENLLKAQLGQSGFVVIKGGDPATTGNFTTVQVASACRISSIAATNSTVGALTAIELPAGFTFNGPITSISLSYGAAIVYKL
jgi:hypothetical protein